VERGSRSHEKGTLAAITLHNSAPRVRGGGDGGRQAGAKLTQSWCKADAKLVQSSAKQLAHWRKIGAKLARKAGAKLAQSQCKSGASRAQSRRKAGAKLAENGTCMMRSWCAACPPRVRPMVSSGTRTAASAMHLRVRKRAGRRGPTGRWGGLSPQWGHSAAALGAKDFAGWILQGAVWRRGGRARGCGERKSNTAMVEWVPLGGRAARFCFGDGSWLFLLSALSSR
jgi:hypothetical protein